MKKIGIFVDKNDRDSRRKAQDSIAEWLRERDRDPELLPSRLGIMPEGWQTNGSKLLKFKSGAFIPGRLRLVTNTSFFQNRFLNNPVGSMFPKFQLFRSTS